MGGLILLVALIFLAGIILLSRNSPLSKKTREEFLQELAEFLEEMACPVLIVRD